MRELDLSPLPRVVLGHGPTPVRRLDGLPATGAQIWVKDDGLYGAYAGNKARKLEWLLGQAQRRGARTVITGGAIGTNHGLATALYARDLGMRCVLVLVPQPESVHVRRQLGRIRETGAELHFARGTVSALTRAALLIAGHTGPRLRPPYLILPGGSTPLGCVGYVEAGLELARQVADGEIPEPSHVLLAAGTGGTAAGLVLGLRLGGLRTRVVAVVVNDLTPVGAGGIARLARRTARLLERRGVALPRTEIGRHSLDAPTDWLGRGYGHPTAAGERATAAFAEAGVTLEPVYTAKAAAAVLDFRDREELGPGPVLYWHTYRPA